MRGLIALLLSSVSFQGAAFMSAVLLSVSALGTEAGLHEHRLSPGFGRIVPEVSYFLDEQGNYGLEDVVTQSFEKVREYPPQFGYTDAAVWLTFRYSNPGDAVWLSVNYPMLDDVQVFILDEHQNLLSAYPLGDRLSFVERVLLRPEFTVPLPSSVLSGSVYLRVQSGSSLEVPMTISEDAVLRQTMENSAWIQGLFFGAVVMLGLYHALIFLSSGDRSYLYFSGLSLAMALIQATLWGRSYQFLWPESPAWNNIAVSTLINTSNVFGALYISKVVKICESHRWIYLAATALAATSTVMVVLSLNMPYAEVIYPTLLLSMMTFLVCATMVVVRMRRGYPPAFAVFVAGLMYTLGSASYILGKLGVFNNSLLLDNALALGQLLQVLLFAFALSVRMAMEKELRERAQRDTAHAQALLLETEREQNMRLDQEVKARTQELREANARLEKISTTDSLTGLYNRRHFDEVLEREYDRGAREGKSLSLIMLDLDYFKNLNDSQGHAFGDEALRQTALRIQDVLNRPADMAFRYGGEEFVILLPDTEASAAHILSRQIWTAMRSEPIVMKDQTVRLTISIGIAVTMPDKDNSYYTLLKRADEKLYQAKNEGRDRICI
ncbi:MULTISPECIES: sensor domain-containing diguanylate cyclase [Thalassolituus]|uniref:sensor domain-containing diguanylate cyclase n=2 Tax=Oceanospirillaceae TaxID=135620 RepID=UPI002648DD44|nr:MULTISPECIES: diguanylate cyclase [Thalassolituus]|tara:strand:+ start:289 stop:2121 length:1833 start_codon:yes stop_codon:yes gene_type:complete